MFLHPFDLTTALRPTLLPDESLLFVQDGVGLYKENVKIPELQLGHIYLTTHRVCYVDNAEPRAHSLAIDLTQVERYELQGGFYLKASPKVILYPKAATNTRSSVQPLVGQKTQGFTGANQTEYPASKVLSTGSPSAAAAVTSATWVCTYCFFSNPVPSHFDPTASSSSSAIIPPCLMCGVKPAYTHVLKAAIANATSNQGRLPISSQPYSAPLRQDGEIVRSDTSILPDLRNLKTAPSTECWRCTYSNHPLLLSCELCGASLAPADAETSRHMVAEPPKAESLVSLLNDKPIKVSFRDGGSKVFYERLKDALIQRKWLLRWAPPIPEPVNTTHEAKDNLGGTDGHNVDKLVGIAGLERRGFEIRKKNEAMIGSAFEDLDALMASAKEIIALAESFAKTSENQSTSGASQIIAENAKALEGVTRREMFGSRSQNENLYLAELARNLAEYLTDDAQGVLHREGGIMTLVDLWAVFSCASGGIEPVSPSDFEKAARLWEKLRLPVRLRQFRSGILVVQQADRTDDKTIAQLLDWLQAQHDPSPAPGISVSTALVFGRGVTAQETAQRFGWSIGVATEELAMAEDNGVLCREEGAEGVKFWENWLVDLQEAEVNEINNQ